MNPVRALRGRGSLVLLLVIGGFAYGLFALYRLPSGIYPDVSFPRVVVVAKVGDLPPGLVETAATRPLEEALATVPGVRRLRSRTIRGAVELSVQFAPGTDMILTLQRCESHISTVRSDLPAGTRLEIQRVTPTALPIVTFNVSGALDPRRLRELATLVIRPALTRVSGVGAVDVLGGEVRQFEVVLHPQRLAAMHLTPSQVADRLSQQDLVSATGRVYEEHQVLTAVVHDEPATAKAIAALPIVRGPNGVVPLSSVADVFEGRADRTVVVAGPKGQTVAVTVARAIGASVPDVVARVKKALAELQSSGAIPKGVRIDTVYDQSKLVNESLKSVRDAILLGALLAVVVLGVSLRDVRAGVAAAVAVPITLMATFGLMHLFGVTLNLMSLGGLAVAIGLVVDDAIVVVEAIVRRVEEGELPERASETGTMDLFAAVVGTTLTTVVVFAPLGLLAGVVGTFFGSLAATLSIAVGLSLLVAVTAVPLLAAKILKARPAPVSEEGARGRFSSQAYGRLIRRLVHRPWIGIVAVLVVIAAGVVAFRFTPTGFLPAMDEGSFVLDFYLPAGTSLEETNRVASGIDRILASIPSIETFTRRTGAEMGPAAATAQNRGDIMVRLVPRSRRPSVDDVIDRVRNEVEADVPEARVEFVQVLQDELDDLSGNPRPIEVRFFGPDPHVLDGIATKAAARLSSLPQLEDLYSGVEGQVPELRAEVNRNLAAGLGVSPQSIADDLSTAMKGRVAAQVRLPDRTLGVRVRFPDAVRFDPQALSNAPLAYGPTSVRVGDVVHWSRPREPAALMRENLMPVVILTAAVHGSDLGAAENAVAKRLRGLKMPTGCRYEVGGQAEGARQTQRQLAAVFGLGIALVLAILLVQLRTLRLSLVVIVGAPLSIVGALITLAASGIPLNASSLMGCVLLAGLVVKNGILLLEHAQQELDSGVPFAEAIARGGERRLRPILMTTAATIAGLLPLAVSPGAGAEILRPLAAATIGGLVLSTLVTLFGMPSLAAALNRIGKRHGERP